MAGNAGKLAVSPSIVVCIYNTYSLMLEVWLFDHLTVVSSLGKGRTPNIRTLCIDILNKHSCFTFYVFGDTGCLVVSPSFLFAWLTLLS